MHQDLSSTNYPFHTMSIFPVVSDRIGALKSFLLEFLVSICTIFLSFSTAEAPRTACYKDNKSKSYKPRTACYKDNKFM